MKSYHMIELEKCIANCFLNLCDYDYTICVIILYDRSIKKA